MPEPLPRHLVPQQPNSESEEIAFEPHNESSEAEFPLDGVRQEVQTIGHSESTEHGRTSTTLSRFVQGEISAGLEPRGVRAFQPLAWLGRLLIPTSPQNLAEVAYQQSFVTERIGEFWSHSWHASPKQKILTLLLYYNGFPSSVVSGLSAGIGCVASLYMAEGERQVEAVDAIAAACGLLGFALTLLLWRSQATIFLDKACINQSNDLEKTEGIKSIGGILHRSNRVLLLWDSTYLTRLWCAYELAALVRIAQLNPKEGFKLRTRPIWLSGLLLILITMAIIPQFRLVLISSGLPDRAVTPILCLLLVPVASSQHFRQAAQFSAEAEQQLQGFSMSEARCFCCDHDHELDGREIPCDRVLITDALEHWFLSIDRFDVFVRRQASHYFRVRFQAPYLYALLSGLPLLWIGIGRISQLAFRQDWSEALIVACGWLVVFILSHPLFVNINLGMLYCFQGLPLNGVKGVASSILVGVLCTASASIPFLAVIIGAYIRGLVGILLVAALLLPACILVHRIHGRRFVPKCCGGRDHHAEERERRLMRRLPHPSQNSSEWTRSDELV